MSKLHHQLFQDIFLISFLTFFIYLGLELRFEGIISNYFDLNILLLVMIISGAASAFGRRS